MHSYNIIFQFNLTKKQYYGYLIKSFSFKNISYFNEKLYTFLDFREARYSDVKPKLLLQKNLIKKIQKVYIYINKFNKYKIFFSIKFYTIFIMYLKALYLHRREFSLHYNLKFYNNFYTLRKNLKRKSFIKNTFLSIKKFSKILKKKKIKIF